MMNGNEWDGWRRRESITVRHHKINRAQQVCLDPAALNKLVNLVQAQDCSLSQVSVWLWILKKARRLTRYTNKQLHKGSPLSCSR